MSRRADQVKKLFEEALDLAEAEREPFVRDNSDGDDALAADVLDLLRALAEASGFLSERATAVDVEGPGTVIDRYELTERIGEGGFGVVFRALQREPLRRNVALKILKLGMDSRSMTARFEHERQALARMQHPNIATVLDGGTTPAGRPYFVMELVDGQPITTHCKKHGLGIAERVALMVDVCMAVQHAHQKGVVHRDLKPANILISASEHGVAQPKVIDFGIAKALERDDEAADFTATQHGQAIGTLEYMPPEQAAGELDQLDSRADVYSLGVLLYELLSGRRPFERSDAPTGTADMISRIREQAPPRPSTVVQRSTEELPLPGADRAQWARRLHGDLDWIIARALQKRPDDRYPTPNALATDLRNYLTGMPVSAGPPTTGYVLRRFLARHKALAATATALLLSIVGGLFATSMALADARAESETKSRAVTAMRTMLLDADPLTMHGPDFTVREMLDAFAPVVAERFAHDPDVDLQLQVTFGGAYRNLAQLEAAQRHLTRGLELARSLGDDEALEYALREWASLQRDRGKLDQAAAALTEALSLAQARNERSTGVATLMLAQADLHRLSDHDELGEPLVNRALAMIPTNTPELRLHLQRALGLDLLGAFAHKRADHQLALDYYRDALAIRQRMLPDEHPLIAGSLNNLASIHRSLGQFDEAEQATLRTLAIRQKAYGEQHPMVANSIASLGDLAMARGNLDDAARHFERSQKLREACLSEDHPQLASALSQLGRIALLKKDHERAAPLLQRALTLRTAANDGEDRALAGLLQNLGIAVERCGDRATARKHYVRSVAMHRRLGGDNNPALPGALTNLAMLCEAENDQAQATEMFLEAAELRRRKQPDKLDLRLRNLVSLARTAKKAGKIAISAKAQRERVGLLEQTGAEAGRITATRAKAARLFLEVDDAASAAALLEPAYEWCKANIPDQWPLGDCASMLATCRIASGAVAEAVQLADESWQLLDTSAAPPNIKRSSLEAVVAAHRSALEQATDTNSAPHEAAIKRAEKILATLPKPKPTAR